MAGATTTVRYSSDLEPDPREFDQQDAVSKTVPELIVDFLDTDRLAADLWTIATTVHAVDRNLRRPDRRAWRRGREWRRGIRARIPVQNPGWWSAHGSDLESLLNWLTADTWRLNFTRGRAITSTPTLYTNEELGLRGPSVLFSGGLDSVCGVVNELMASEVPLNAVSVSTNTRMESRQASIYRGLRRLEPRLRTWFTFRLQVHLPNPEDTARSRGLVFLTAGVLSAIARGTNALWLYENGPGALNLALTRGQVGAQAARAVHPKTLQGMERLARAVSSDAGFRIENRAFDRTKAQMVQEVPPGDAFDQVLADTISCDTGFSHHSAGAPHCGGCTSCILRRQALAAAGRNVPTPTRGAPGHKEDHRKLMSWQVARMRHALRKGPSWAHMVREFPDLVCDPDSFRPEHRSDLLRLFDTYATEWELEEVIRGFTENPP